MNVRDGGLVVEAAGPDLQARIEAIDWRPVHAELDAQGTAVIPELLSTERCRELAALYPHDGEFRSRVVMARHGFGRGEYRYFAYPLPALVETLRTSLYPHQQHRPSER